MSTQNATRANAKRKRFKAGAKYHESRGASPVLTRGDYSQSENSAA